MKKYIVILFISINLHFVYSQNDIFCLDSIYHYNVGDKTFCYSRISFFNKTTEKVLFWFNDPRMEIKKNPFYDYFFKRIGDFTLYDIITENGGTLVIGDSNNFHVIFKTFYKIIQPNSSFDVYIIYDEERDYACINKLNITQTIAEDELKKISISIDDKFETLSYKPDYIVVMESLFR